MLGTQEASWPFYQTTRYLKKLIKFKKYSLKMAEPRATSLWFHFSDTCVFYWGQSWFLLLWFLHTSCMKLKNNEKHGKSLFIRNGCPQPSMISLTCHLQTSNLSTSIFLMFHYFHQSHQSLGIFSILIWGLGISFLLLLVFMYVCDESWMPLYILNKTIFFRSGSPLSVKCSFISLNE